MAIKKRKKRKTVKRAVKKAAPRVVKAKRRTKRKSVVKHRSRSKWYRVEWSPALIGAWRMSAEMQNKDEAISFARGMKKYYPERDYRVTTI